MAVNTDWLAQIVQDQSKLSDLPCECLPAMMAKLAALQSAVLARMLDHDYEERPGGPSRRRTGEMELLTIAEVSKLFKVSENRIYDLVRRGELDSILIGKKHKRVPVEAIQEYFARQSNKPLENRISRRHNTDRDGSGTPKAPKAARPHTASTRLTFPQATGEDGEV